MTLTSERHLPTGGDPRTLADYAALRDELNKLTHPARPDVNWLYAEKLCLSLFEHNGMELQTAAWYTLVRTQLAGLTGMNEGLSILETLITRQWGNLWPQAVHVRMDILSILARRLQQHLRAMTLNYADLSALYQAEKHLTATGDTLQRLELKHQTGLDALGRQLRQAAVCLENSHRTADGTAASPRVLPEPAVMSAERGEGSRSRSVWVMPPAVESHIPVVPAPLRTIWKPFVAGMLTMLLTGALALWGGQRFADNPNQKALMATVAPLPAPLPEETLKRLRQARESGRNTGDMWFRQARQQLGELARQSPAWSLNYGSELIRQAQELWPERPETGALTGQWHEQLTAIAASAGSLEGWRQGMAQLQHLTDRLNKLDEQKGKYMTVSELKSQVFAITQAFNQAVPVEEQLRQLAAQPANLPVPAALRTQTELHLKQLLARYVLLTR